MGSSRLTSYETIAAGRIAVGATFWLPTTPAARLSGLDVDRNPQLPVLARIAGTRDIALGFGALRARRSSRRAWIAAGVACDVADAVTFVHAGATRRVSPVAAAWVAASALGYAALGLRLLLR